MIQERVNTVISDLRIALLDDKTCHRIMLTRISLASFPLIEIPVSKQNSPRWDAAFCQAYSS